MIVAQTSLFATEEKVKYPTGKKQRWAMELERR